ncbi:unnamed protein product [Rhodiola kirilowii]
MFLCELEEVLEVSSMAGFQDVMIPIVYRVTSCLTRSHYRLAERALTLLWNNKHISRFCGAPTCRVLLPIVIPRIGAEHLQPLESSGDELDPHLKKMLYEMDTELVLPCLGSNEEYNTKSITEASKEQNPL